MARNVAALIDLPKAPKPEPQALDEAEVNRLLETPGKPSGRSIKRDYLTAEPWLAPAVAFSVYTGARRGEVFAVKWSDVNLEAKSVTIRRSLVESRSAGRSSRSKRTAELAQSALPGPLVAVPVEHKERQQQEAKLSAMPIKTTFSCSLAGAARSPGLGTMRQQSRT